MGKVLAFKIREDVTCDNCFQHSKQGSDDTRWDFTLLLDADYLLRIIMYQTGWTKNQIIRTTLVDKQEKHVADNELYLCPDCNNL
jgi:hypothetical protein